jgi:hypothetical protein
MLSTLVASDAFIILPEKEPTRRATKTDEPDESIQEILATKLSLFVVSYLKHYKG